METSHQRPDVLVIDNYDSFTYNLVQCLGMLGHKIMVCRNDKTDIAVIRRIRPKRIVISPGPGRPDEAGISKHIIQKMYQQIPILGVCLGHQCIAESFSADIIPAGEIVHGKTSRIYHDGATIYESIDMPFVAARYHSLVIKAGTIGKDFEVSAWTNKGIIMGIRHKRFALEGVQFHPESFLTKNGMQLLRNFLRLENPSSHKEERSAPDINKT